MLTQEGVEFYLHLHYLTCSSCATQQTKMVKFEGFIVFALQSSNILRDTTLYWRGSWEREPSEKSSWLSVTTSPLIRRRYLWLSRYSNLHVLVSHLKCGLSVWVKVYIRDTIPSPTYSPSVTVARAIPLLRFSVSKRWDYTQTADFRSQMKW